MHWRHHILLQMEKHGTTTQIGYPPKFMNVSGLLHHLLLRIFLVNDDSLQGTLPFGLWRPVEAMTIELQNNLFTGTMEPSYGSLTNLERLLFDYNHLRGEVPTEFGYLTNLRSLGLVNPLLSGSIPLQVCSLFEEGQLSELTIDCDSQIRCDCNCTCG